MTAVATSMEPGPPPWLRFLRITSSRWFESAFLRQCAPTWVAPKFLSLLPQSTRLRDQLFDGAVER